MVLAAEQGLVNDAKAPFTRGNSRAQGSTQ